MKPAIATQTIFCFVASWTNDWVPRIVILDDQKKILPIASAAPGAELLLSIPPIILYLFLSKQIVEGISLGSVKM
jgi:multiple sugar transport system permease protein